MAGGGGGFDYEGTQSWRLALFFFCFGLVSVGTEHALHWVLHYFEEKKKFGLKDMVEKLKDELMLLGFISLVLVLLQDRILRVCVPECGGIWGSCANGTIATDGDSRRRLGGAAEPVECEEGEEPFISLTALHQIHIFIFVLAVSLVGTGTAAMLAALGRLNKWSKWEKEAEEFDQVLDENGSSVAANEKWHDLERSHSRGIWKYIGIPLFGADKVTFLYLRRYFIRKHKRAKGFGFTKYITACTEDEFAQTLEIDGQDWLVAMLTVALRDYYFSLWTSCLSFALSVLTGVKLSAIARMLGQDTRDMANRPTVGNSPMRSGRKGDQDVSKYLDDQQEEVKMLAQAKQAFAEADSDSGGTLDRDEVRMLLETLGCEVDGSDDAYYNQVFARFDMDGSGALEYDEFLQCWRFMQAHKEDFSPSDERPMMEGNGSAGGSARGTPSRKSGFQRTVTTKLGVATRNRPDLKRGRVTWCCGRFGPKLNASRLRPLVGFIIFQNAMAMAQVIFNIWQLGSSSLYFTQPDGVPGGMLLLQGSLFVLQMLHTSLVLLPMFALVKQMGRHYNARLFGASASKAITEWVSRAKHGAKKKGAAEGQGAVKHILGGITKTRSKMLNGVSPTASGSDRTPSSSRSSKPYTVGTMEATHDEERGGEGGSDDGLVPEPQLEVENLTSATASELLAQGELPALPPVPGSIDSKGSSGGNGGGGGGGGEERKQKQEQQGHPPPSPLAPGMVRGDSAQNLVLPPVRSPSPNQPRQPREP